MSLRQRRVPDRIQTYYNASWDEKLKYTVTDKKFGTVHCIGILLTLSSLIYSVYVCEMFLPTPNPVDAPKTVFSAVRARRHLTDLTKIGPRVSGSYANDIEAVGMLVRDIGRIKKMARKGFHIDIDVQTGSGSFAFVRKATSFTSVYDNITNVLVRISSTTDDDVFLLVNAHYDTVPNTEGASDDGVSCAVLLEAFRCITQSDPSSLKHGMIFLFNGAEEGGLGGSHLFVNKHKWFPLVKAVVNLEAAGSGGREFVFQTGPQHPWILRSYANSAKYPFASVVAQEIFQSGVIPSDTDFRVFVGYGKLIGIDLAFISNGYVYHTRHDNAEAIPDGSIQRAGDNVLALIQTLANSPYIVDPGVYKHGNTVYFELLGVTMISYSDSLHSLLSYLTCGVVISYIILRSFNRKFSSGANGVTIFSLFVSSCFIILSYFSALFCAVAVSLVLTKLNVLLTWYTHVWFAILLYGLPAMFGMLFVHYVGSISMSGRGTNITILSSVCGHLLIYSLILLYLNSLQILSSFLVWLWVIFPFVLLCLPLNHVEFNKGMEHTATFLLHLLGTLPPALITIYHLNTSLKFFCAIFGRSGTSLPSDVVMAVLIAISVVMVMSYFMNLAHAAANLRHLVAVVGLFSVVIFLYALTGRMQPYANDDVVRTPKRMFMQHTLRTFYNSDGSIRKQDSGIWVQPMDYFKVTQLNGVPFYKDLQDLPCEGSYCGLPYYYGMRIVARQQWFLFGEKPGIDGPLTPNIYKRELTALNRIRFYFNISGPDHMNVFLTLKPGAKLVDWSMYKGDRFHSLENFHEPRSDVYMLFYTRGFYADSWKFWFEIEKLDSATSDDIAELGLARHYLHGDKARSRFLTTAIDALPSVICENAWTSNYDSFVLK